MQSENYLTDEDGTDEIGTHMSGEFRVQNIVKLAEVRKALSDDTAMDQTQKLSSCANTYLSTSMQDKGAD